MLRLESRLRAEELQRHLEDIDGVAVRPELVKSIEELELSNHLAKKAFQNRKNIARKFKYEFLLWLSGTRDIKNAIKKTAPGGEFLLILFSDYDISKLKAKEKKLNLKKTADPLALERISLSRI